MLQQIKNFIINKKLIYSNEHIICALSGGIDSTFLFFILYKLSIEMNFTFSVCHINHMLRKNDSYEDMLFVKKLCQNYKVDLDYKIVNTINFCKNKCSIEIGAREIRYKFFNELLNKYQNSKIATAHNCDDNVETIILNLLRGCYTLRGIPILRDKIIRPLINISRKDILYFLETNNIAYRKDITNDINIYNRNKIRNLVFPIFNIINNKYINNITNTYLLLKSEDEYLNQIAKKLIKNLIIYDNKIIKIEINKIIKIEYFLIRRIILLIIKKYININCMNAQLNNIIKVIFSSNPSSVTIIDKYKFSRQYNWLYIYEIKKEFQINKIELNFIKKLNYTYNIEVIKNKLNVCINIINKNNYYKLKIEKNNNVFYFDYDKINISTFHLRTRMLNDKIFLDNFYGYRKLKNLFINKKIPNIYRDLIPLLVDKNNIIFCLFIGMDKNYKVNDNTKKILKIEFRSDLYERIFS